MYFIKNLADEKLEIYFTKEIYQALPDDQKKFIKSSCLFSSRNSCWRSRAKLQSTGRLERWLLEHGFEDKGTEGQKLSFADKVLKEQDRANERVDIMDARHDKAVSESASLWKAADQILSHIPPGQPILVGHHSEKRHRRDLEKTDNLMRRSIEADEKANYYRNKFNNALATAEGEKYKNAGYLTNRVKECERDIRLYERRLLGKMYVYDTPREISEDERTLWNERKAEAEDKLRFMNYCLSQIQAVVYDKDKMEEAMDAGAKQVMIKGRFVAIVRLNKTTISVENGCFSHSPELMKKYALKYYYGQIQNIQ